MIITLFFSKIRAFSKVRETIGVELVGLHELIIG